MREMEGVVYEDGTVEHTGQYLNTKQSFFPNYEFVRQLKRELEKDKGTIFILIFKLCLIPKTSVSLHGKAFYLCAICHLPLSYPLPFNILDHSFPTVSRSLFQFLLFPFFFSSNPNPPNLIIYIYSIPNHRRLSR